MQRKKRRKKRLLGIKIGISILSTVLCLLVLLFIVNRWKVTVTLKGLDHVVVEYGTEYQEEGIEARLHGTILFKKGFLIDYDIEKNYDATHLGQTSISYVAEFMGMSDHITRTIDVVDTTAPEISLVTVEGKYTLPGEDYEEEGFGAIDNYDGNITDKVIRVEKDGIVTYTVTDSSGNTAEITRTIVYNDPKEPKLVLKGENIITLLVGTEYEEPGYTAIDNCDGDITEQVVVQGEVDCNTLGQYVLTYRVQDQYGNEMVKQRVICYVDTEAPKIILNGEETIYHNIGTEYIDAGYSATDNYDGDVTEQVIVTGEVDANRSGTYTITYKVTDSNGNEASVVQTVHVQDYIAPELTLIGEINIVIQVGDSYSEPGYIATDNYDGDLTSTVVVNGGVNVNKPGTYVITYEVSDHNGNKVTAQRVVKCYDPVPPVLVLTGEKHISMNAGTTYIEPGYIATDNYDGNLTSAVRISGGVNPYHAGTYTITYTVSDSSGNTVSDVRTVTVNPVRQPDTITPDGKVVYLTFDDGPSKYTDKLLGILEQYNVKVTFFVVNTPYIDKVATIAAAGHTVALHSYSHNYAQIYASEEAYFADLNLIQSAVYERTGILSKLVRFPGGSSNRISAQFCVGIMTSLTKALHSMGYQYFDWNVTSGDAGGVDTSEAVFQNVIKGIQGKDVAVVLQHDIYEFSVDAVENIIIWGLANGYTFLPLDETSPAVHHKVAN